MEPQQIWERVMETSSWPKIYHETHVLLLGWIEEFDDTETTKEVSRESGPAHLIERHILTFASS